MRTLIPRDNWEHRMADLARGLTAGLGKGERDVRLDISGLGSGIPVGSGRAAIVAALRALNLPPGARVAVPLYCCPVVFSAIKAAGCRVRFIDVDPTTFCMSAADLSAKRAEVEAIIAVHMFGNTCDVLELEQAGGGRPIIEDCAQAIGSRRNGDPVGSFGVFGVFSFRSGKYLSVGEGGALFSRDAGARSRAAEVVSAMPVSGAMEECVHVLRCYLKSVLRSRPFYGLVGYPLWKRWNKNGTASAVTDASLKRIRKADYAVATRRLLNLDSAIERQREIAGFYSSALELDAGMLCAESPGAYYNRYYYPVTFPSSDHRDRIASILHRAGIDSIKYLDDVVQVARDEYGYSEDCPEAKRLSKSVLIIPGYYSLKNRDVERVAKQLNMGWRELTRSGRDRQPAKVPTVSSGQRPDGYLSAKSSSKSGLQV